MNAPADHEGNLLATLRAERDAALAEKAALATDNARVLGELRERTGELAERNAAFAERIDHQAATIDVLKEMSSSPSDAQPVFDLICGQARALLGTQTVSLFEYDGTLVHRRAGSQSDSFSTPAARADYLSGWPRVPDRGSLSCRAILDGTQVHVRDMDAEPGVSADIRALGTKTQLSIPLMRDGRAIGAITTSSMRVDGISDTQIELLKTFAEQAAIAITSAETWRALHARTSELQESLEYQTATSEVLNVISRSTADVQPVLDSMAKTAARLCNADSGSIWVRDGDVYRNVSSSFSEAEPEFWAALRRRRLVPGRDSLTGRVALEGRTVHIGDIRADPDFALHESVEAGLHTVLGVPLLRDGEPIGTIGLSRKRVEPFTERQIELVRTFADQAVIAMENARLLTETREALEQQTATAELLRIINESPGNPQPVFDAMLEKATLLCGVAFGFLATWDGTTRQVVAVRGLPPAVKEYSVTRVATTPSPGVMHVLETARPYQIVDLMDDDGYREGHPDSRMIVDVGGVRTCLHIPLIKDDASIGYFSFYRREVSPFSGKEIALMESFAAQAVIAMENARLLGELRERTAELADRNAAFAERIDHQAATIDVLKEMSNSPGDAQPVFDLICRQAKALLGAPIVALLEYDGTLVHLRANPGVEDVVGKGPYATYQNSFPMVPDRGSISCRAILDGSIMHIRDLAAEPGISETIRVMGYRTQVAIPLMRDGRAIGAISAGSMNADGISDTQIELLKTFAEQAVIAIGSAETYRALQERTAALAQRNSEFGERIEQQAATIDVLKVMSSTPDDTQPVFDQIVRRARELCNSPSAALFQFDGELVHYSARALPDGFDESADEFISYRDRFPMAPDPGSLTCRAILEKRVIHIRDIQVEPGLPAYLRDVLGRIGLRSQVTVPLLRDGAALGAITLNALTSDGFSDSQIALLQTFAEQAVIAIGSVATFRALRERTDELARRQNELRVTFENMGDGVAMFDETQRLVAWNRRFQDIIEVPDEVIARRPTIRDYIRYLAERGEYGPDADPEEQVSRLTETIGQRLAYERTRPNGTIIEIRNNPVASGGFVVIYADITGRKRAESAIRAARDAAETALRDLQTAQDRLIQAEKMASLGQLTAGIAHEIKNPLNFVNNFASLSVELLDELKETAAPAFATLNGDARMDVEDLTETLTGNLKKIEEHGKRADGIVRSMLEHSRGSSSERRAVDINDLVDEALNLAFHGARARDQSFNITLERDFSTAIAPIEVNPQDLTRVFLNLFSNGFYAANKRAKDGATTGFAPVLKASTREVGDAVEIRVRDNGTGIPDEIRDKLFQPFFTTKPTGEGTGLGLSITYDIVTNQHRGTIAVDSRVGSFTEFIVTIPHEPRPGGGAP